MSGKMTDMRAKKNKIKINSHFIIDAILLLSFVSLLKLVLSDCTQPGIHFRCAPVTNRSTSAHIHSDTLRLNLDLLMKKHLIRTKLSDSKRKVVSLFRQCSVRRSRPRNPLTGNRFSLKSASLFQASLFLQTPSLIIIISIH